MSMHRCRTKKNKKWRVRLIPQRPSPTPNGTCNLWRFWTQNSTPGQSVNMRSCLLFSRAWLVSFLLCSVSKMPDFQYSWLLFMAFLRTSGYFFPLKLLTYSLRFIYVIIYHQYYLSCLQVNMWWFLPIYVCFFHLNLIESNFNTHSFLFLFCIWCIQRFISSPQL